jgi:hypothetical protein
MQGWTWLKPWPPRPLILVLPPACGFTRNCAEISPFPAPNFGSHKLIPATEIACGNAGLRLRVKLMYWVGSPVITLRATPPRLLACSSVEDLSLSLSLPAHSLQQKRFSHAFRCALFLFIKIPCTFSAFLLQISVAKFHRL